MTTTVISSASHAFAVAKPTGSAGTLSTGSSDTSFADALAALAQAPSQQETNLPKAQGAAAATQAPRVYLDTVQGKFAANLDEYFAPHVGADLDSLPPLLFPTADNIATLSSDASEKLRQLLAQLKIPAPDSIKYGNDGQMQLPSDYAYADEFRDALDARPALQRELSTVNALTSHYAAMQESLPFLQAYGAARTRAEVNQVVQQFSYLFNGARDHAAIELDFSETGGLTPTINGKPLKAGVNSQKASLALA